MLKQSVTLNFAITELMVRKLKAAEYVSVCVFLFVALAFTPRDGMLLPSVCIAAVITGIVAGIFVGIFRLIFAQSLFGEDAYTYMQFPLSSRSVVLGKVIAAGYYLLWNLLFLGSMWTFLYYWWRDLEYGIVSWDLKIVDCLTRDILSIGQMLFQRNFGAGAIAFFIGASILQLLISTGLLCSGVQLCCILQHFHNPSGKKKYMGFLYGLALAGGIAAILYLPTKMFCLISDGFITILPLVVTMGLEIILIIALMRWSIKLLQTKYELN